VSEATQAKMSDRIISISVAPYDGHEFPAMLDSIASCGAQIDPAKDALVAMPGCGHVHLKDVQTRIDGYYFVPIGEGDVDCPMILQAVKVRPDLTKSRDRDPLRFHRNLAAQPCRNNSPIEIFEIEAVLRKSLDFVRQQLA
jgi:sugar phosphate isomerase/epimerase